MDYLEHYQIESKDWRHTSKGAIGNLWAYALFAVVITCSIVMTLVWVLKETALIILFMLPFIAVDAFFIYKTVHCLINLPKSILFVSDNELVVFHKRKYITFTSGEIHTVEWHFDGFSAGTESMGRESALDSASCRIVTVDGGEFVVRVRQAKRAQAAAEAFQSGMSVTAALEAYDNRPKALERVGRTVQIAFLSVVCAIFIGGITFMTVNVLSINSAISNPKITLSETELSVKAKYSFSVKYEQIVSAQFCDEKFNLTYSEDNYTSTLQNQVYSAKTTGKLNQWVYLFNLNNHCYVELIDADGTKYFLNLYTKEETIELCNKITVAANLRVA